MSTAYKLLEGLEEPSLEHLNSKALKEGTFCDVTLVANDGVQVPAHRLLLLRSSLFETMLKGGFSEATSPMIKVDFPGTITKAVVEYIYSNQVSLLSEFKPENVDDNGNISEAGYKQFQTLVNLTEAAAYYNLPKLCQLVNNHMESYVENFPSLSFAVLEACAQEHPAISSGLQEKALANMRQNKYEQLDETVVQGLSYSVLARILADKKAGGAGDKHFELVRIWSTGALDDNEDRKKRAKLLVKDHLNLAWIKPALLATSVASSGLVDSEQLFEAYKQQAMKAQKQGVFFWSTVV